MKLATLVLMFVISPPQSATRERPGIVGIPSRRLPTPGDGPSTTRRARSTARRRPEDIVRITGAIVESASDSAMVLRLDLRGRDTGLVETFYLSRTPP
jgi:hypothetical protein